MLVRDVSMIECEQIVVFHVRIARVIVQTFVDIMHLESVYCSLSRAIRGTR